MSPRKYVKFPPLNPSQKQRLTCDHNDATASVAEEGGDSAVPAARKLCWTSSTHIYAGAGRKPPLLLHLESYVNKELQVISPNEPRYQELKLQVYSDAFGYFIKEFKSYQPLLSAIKKEYENTLVCQQAQIQELEALRTRLRLVTEECDRKIQARWAEEQSEIGALKREKQQLKTDAKAMREREKAMQATVDRLQSDLSSQYVQYREERDARRLLIWKLNSLTGVPVRDERPENTEEAKDSVELQLALKVCQKDLTKAQEELTRMKADYWDVVPRRDWDALEQTHKRKLLQLKTLKGDFDQLKSEYDTLLELQRANEENDQVTAQADKPLESFEQSQILSSHLKDPESGTAPLQELRPPGTVAPLKPDVEADKLVTSTQSEPDNSSDDIISSQRLHGLQLAGSGAAAFLPVLQESGEDAATDLTPVD